MIEVEASVVIERPVEEVFAFLTDHRNDVRWQEGLLEAQVTPEGARGINTRVTTVCKLLNRRADSTVEICEFVPGRKEVFRTVTGPLDMTGWTACEPSGAGTLVTRRLQMQTRNFFSLPDSAVASYLRRKMDAGLAEVKDLLERRGRIAGVRPQAQEH